MIWVAILFAVPIAILIFALLPQEGRKPWFAHWTYALGAIAGGITIVAIAVLGRPILIPVYGAYHLWLAKVLTMVAGPRAGKLIPGLAAAVFPIVLWHMGVAAGIWVVWRNRKPDRR